MALFESETAEIKELLKPKHRRYMDAVTKARSLAVLEGTINGNHEQPCDGERCKICKRLVAGEKWGDIFPGR